MPRLLTRAAPSGLSGAVVITVVITLVLPGVASAGFGGGYGGTSGSGIWALAWWLGNPEGPGPFVGPEPSGADLCVWHDTGESAADLVGALGEAGLPKSFWDVPRSGGHEGIWGVLAWAEARQAGAGAGDHFDLVACPEAGQVPPTSGDVERLPTVKPKHSQPLHLWVFWDTVPDPPSGSLPPVVDEAFSEMGLPQPSIGTSPSEIDGTPEATVVNVATWLWVGASIWHTFSATATAGPYVATVWADPVSVTWTASWDFTSPQQDPEGATSLSPFSLDLSCSGPGKVYEHDVPAAEQSTDCSADFAPTFGLRQPLSATVSWKVHWALSGTDGVVGGEGYLPDATTSSSTGLRVMQVESVITAG